MTPIVPETEAGTETGTDEAGTEAATEVETNEADLDTRPESAPAHSSDAPDPRSGGAGARFFRGAGYVFRGVGFVLSRQPGLILFCLAPLLINLLVFIGVAVCLYHYYDDLVSLIWARPDSWLVRTLWYLLYGFILALILLLGYVVFFVVQAMLSAPFNDLLSERVEVLAYGRRPPPFSPACFGRGVVRTLLHEAAKVGVYLAIMVPLFLLSLLLPVIGAPLFLIGGFYVTATFAGYDFLDYSMARREWPLGRKRAALRENRALTFGFGAALAGVLLLPVIGILCVPFAAVGGTLLFCDLERSGAFGVAEHASDQGGARG